MLGFHRSKILSLFFSGLFISLAIFFVLVNSFSAQASFNPEINYQGKLSDSSGNDVPDGDYNFRFRICTANVGGACSGSVVYDETYISANKVPVSHGLFSIMIGSVSSTLNLVDFNKDLYLEVQIGGSSTPSWETLSPVKQLGAVTNAFNAQKFDGLATTSFLRSDATNSQGLFSSLIVSGLTSLATTTLGYGSYIGGLTDNVTVSQFSVIGGRYASTSLPLVYGYADFYDNGVRQSNKPLGLGVNNQLFITEDPTQNTDPAIDFAAYGDLHNSNIYSADIKYVTTSKQMKFEQAAGGYLFDGDLTIASSSSPTTGSLFVQANATTTGNFEVGGRVKFTGVGAGSVTIDANGNLTASSDERLKNVIGSFDRGLDEILNINPEVFKYNELSGLDTKNTYAGFIAQNVQTWIPEAVKTNKNGYLSLDDRPILGALVNSIKTLNQQINGGFVASRTFIVNNNFEQSSQTLSVAQSAIFYGTITVKGEANFESKVTFKNNVEIQGKLYVDKDQTGSAVVKAGSTAIDVIFSQPYQTVPNIVANLVIPTSTDAVSAVFTRYAVTNKSVNGFSIIIDQLAMSDLHFDWIAMGLRIDPNNVPAVSPVTADNNPIASPNENIQPIESSTTIANNAAIPSVDETAETSTPAVNQDADIGVVGQ